jgi:integrase/recombinase XerD
VTVKPDNYYKRTITKVKTQYRIQKPILKDDSNNDNVKPTLSPTLERKLEDVTAGLRPSFLNVLQTITRDNALTIADYILAMKTDPNLSDNYRRDNITILCRFSRYNDNKPFKATNRNNIVTFLESFREPEATDPLHKWIGTYNLYRIYLMRFFKWLFYPDIEPDKRPKPEVIRNIPKIRRKEHSIYKPTDLWTVEDDLLFLKYCPSKRTKCYHMVSRDLSCRPHEILKLKLKDIVFKTTGTNQYAQVHVNGKTGTRHLPLIDSLPYVKDYLNNEHPQPGNPESIFISSTGKNLGRKLHATSLHGIYDDLKKGFFPRLLQSAVVPSEDKQKIKELLKKPWNLYIRRHSALTRMSGVLKEADLRVYAGWTTGSEMPKRYIHKFGNEACESILAARGILSKDQQVSNLLQSKQCPNCSEPNKPDSKFCAKCRMVLTYDAYSETLDKQHEKESEVQVLRQKYERDMKSMRQEMENRFQQILSKIDIATLK